MTKDKELHKLTLAELERQMSTLQMIPSENFCSKAVLEAQGSILTNKYAEGYPKKRYYQGNSFVDDIELLAIDRAKQLFGAEHANVQPNSGSPANMAVYFALLKPGDKIMGMDLNHGGHLTHGSSVNFSGNTYQWISYGVGKNGLLDMEEIRKTALREKPKLILSGYTAYPRQVPFREFHEIAKQAGAYSMADIAHIAGLIAGGAHPSPLPFTDVVTTTTHKTLRGPRSAIILCKHEFARAIDKAVFPGLQGGPHMHTIAAKATCFLEAMLPEFREYASATVKNAKVLADTLMQNKISLVSNGTDTHLILIDLIRSIGKEGMGRQTAVALEQAGIICNANTIPYEPCSPFKPSGIRMGTAALTTAGMREKEMETIGFWIASIIKDSDNSELKESTKKKVESLCSGFRFYDRIQ